MFSAFAIGDREFEDDTPIKLPESGVSGVAGTRLRAKRMKIAFSA
jgi:hypothetical protein